MLRKLYIEPTTKCNLNCKMCFRHTWFDEPMCDLSLEDYRRAIDTMGVDRILFGTDYPTCNPAMYLGGVLLDPLVTDAEKEKIFSLNAKRLLHL